MLAPRCNARGWQIVSSRAQGEASGTCRSSMPAMTRRKSPSACATPGWTWRCAAAICISPTYYNDTSEIDRLA